MLLLFAQHLDPQLVAMLQGYNLSPWMVVVIAVVIVVVKTAVSGLASLHNPDGTPAEKAYDIEARRLN
jgi:hypothetical protein